MKKPYIYFCGSKEKCDNIAESCKGKIKSAFITPKNAERLLNSSESYPALICLIFSDDIFANNDLLKKVYEYAVCTKCPIHVDGSRHNVDTVLKYTAGGNVQRSSEKLMLKTIDELCELYADNPDSEFLLLKARFQSVAVISDDATVIALCEDRISDSQILPRIIISSERCTDKEVENLKNTRLSGIISDKPLNDNSLELFLSAIENESPAILLDCDNIYSRRLKINYLDSETESGKITELIDKSSYQKSKMLFLKNK